MAIPITLLVNAVSSLVAGPIAKMLEAHIQDVQLRRKLEADIQTRMIDHLGKELGLGQAVVMAEVQSEHWLTRSWRPILMLTLVGFLVFVGLLLPLADLAIGQTIPFNPRWQTLPDGFWDFLAVGVGGYIGGRSLEKIVRPVRGRSAT